MKKEITVAVVKPTYTFKVVEAVEGAEVISPIKRVICKTMPVTDEFNIFDVFTYVAKMKKAIEDKKAEIAGMESVMVAYENEIKEIENELSVQAMEADFQKEINEKNVEGVMSELKKLQDAEVK